MRFVSKERIENGIKTFSVWDAITEEFVSNTPSSAYEEDTIKHAIDLNQYFGYTR